MELQQNVTLIKSILSMHQTIAKCKWQEWKHKMVEMKTKIASMKKL